MSTVSRFAAAFGLAPKAKAEDTKDDEDKKARRAKARERKADESDEDYAKRCAAEDEKDKAEDDKEKKKDPDDDKEGKKGAKDDDEKCAAARAQGVTAERTRWETVLADQRAADRGIAACHMLAATDMGADVILSTLAALPAQATSASDASGLAARMAAVNSAVKPPAPGGGKGPTEGTAAHTASLISAAAAKARGETSK